MNTPIALSRLHFPVTALGPGRRIGVWFQGCSIRCPGCISADTWGFRPSDVTVDDVVQQLRPWLDQADGVTVSGGEPFDQAEALRYLLERLRHISNIDVLVFTGYPREAIEVQLTKMDGLIDALVDGPYDMKVPPTRALRGSDNQRLWCLTERGVRKFDSYDGLLAENSRALDVSFGENGQVWFAGIPRSGEFQQLRRLLEATGHKVQTTEDASWRRQK